MAIISLNPAAALAGMEAYNLGDNIHVSRAAEVAIPFGRYVVRGASDAVAKLPTATGQVTGSGLGFALRDMAKEPNAALGYNALQMVEIGTFGFFWVYCETAAAFGGSVFARFTTATDGSDLGQVRNDADTNKAVAIPNARFEQTISAAGLVIVRLSLV